MRQLVCVACFCLTTAWIVGCTPSNPPAPPLATVKGTVTLDGAPMAEGQLLFVAPAQPTKELAIKNGEFSGEVHTGKNQVTVVLEKAGPPGSTDKKEATKINAVAPKTHDIDVPKNGASDLKFEATSAK